MATAPARGTPPTSTKGTPTGERAGGSRGRSPNGRWRSSPPGGLPTASVERRTSRSRTHRRLGVGQETLLPPLAGSSSAAVGRRQQEADRQGPPGGNLG